MDRYPLPEKEGILSIPRRLKYSLEKEKTEVEFNYERSLKLNFLLKKQVQLQTLEIHQDNWNDI